MIIAPHSAHAPILIDQAGQAIRADPWCFLGADQGIEDKLDVVLGLDRLEAMSQQLAGRNGRIGVMLEAGQALERVLPFLDQLKLIAIEFPSFKDGRGFSSARLLRARYGFTGEIRAVGEVLADQLGFMLRCGFTAFALRNPYPEAAFAAATERFSYHYQAAVERRAAIASLRHQKDPSHES